MRPEMCSCCEPPARPTPVTIDNRAGLSAIAYRVGTFSSFRQAMLQALAYTPELEHLKTRLSDDYAITILEMWAIVADILTFYQERLANEAYLLTARHRDSVLRLARLLDYHLRPGAAATAFLAFTLDKGKQVTIPVGLKVQSVPGQDEKPQKFETLEKISALSSLNRLRMLPPPVGINPLAWGSTEALLAPGASGLAAAAQLRPGDALLLFGDEAIEELEVREVRTEDDRLILAWSNPIRGLSWDVTTRVRKVDRKMRLFGCNAPPECMKTMKTEPDEGFFKWELVSITAWDGSGDPPEDNSFGFRPGNRLHLETRYEDLKPGAQFLVSDQGGKNTLVTVTAVEQGQDRLGPLSDTVTRLTFNRNIPDIKDRRQVVLYKLTDLVLEFWGYSYPGEISTPTIFIPGRRTGAETMEVGRSIAGNAYQPGVQVGLQEMNAGRTVLLQDDRHGTVAARITGASLLGLEVVTGSTSLDNTTVFELGLDAKQSRVATFSVPLPKTLSLTSPQPQVYATIGSLGPRLVRLAQSPADRAEAAGLLEEGLRQADQSLAFSQSEVLVKNNRLIVLPGVAGVQVSFAASPEDKTTARELGLDPEYHQILVGLASAPLDPFPALSRANPELEVTIGPIGPRTIKLAGTPTTLYEAANQIIAGLNAADAAPAFSQAQVRSANLRLVIMPGLVGDEFQEYLVLALKHQSDLLLDSRSAVLLGNVALASHGETVKSEIIGDGDAAATYQRFDLKKKPVTFVSRGGPEGVRSSLQVLVNGGLWQEVPSLFGRSPTDQVYATQIADDATMTVQFGDGKTGARLPSGRGNIIAGYRQGLGLAGRVRAQTLTTLLDRPVGLKAVTNPNLADGGADPETLDQARRNAPNTVRTFQRAVSLRDFEDLITASGEVAKARATWVWNGLARVVHLTVAGQKGGRFSPEALARLHDSLADKRDPHHALFLDNFQQVPIVIEATLGVAGARVAAEVEAAARAGLLAELSFEAMDFGQPIHLSDIYRILQEVQGVEWVDIDRLHFKVQTPEYLADRGATAAAVQGHLRISRARPHPAPPPLVQPAEQAWNEMPARDLILRTSGGLSS
jgi:uncharacterized phage protein gp47/JayE